MEDTVLPSDHWRARAEEARAQLAEMTDPEAGKAMQLVVENYEKLAAITEAHERRNRDET